MSISARALARIASSFSITAEEKLTPEAIDGAVYLFGSELGVLRIYRDNHDSHEGARTGYSVSRQSHFFAYEHEQMMAA